LAIAALILTPGIANAQLADSGGASTFEGVPTLGNPIFEQFADCTGGGPASQQFPDFADAVLQSADDFNVSGSQTLNQVVALGSPSNAAAFALDSVTIEIYDIDGPGNFPGTLLCSETGLANAGGANDPAIDVALDGSCTLGSGSYWMSVLPVMPFGSGVPGQWFWSSNASGFGSEFVFHDPTALLGPGPCQDWGLGITTCGIGATFPDLCFGVGAAGGDGGGTGTPAVGTTGVIVMLLVVMAISFFYLRRRQTA
jgi:hypothetical protein